MKYGWMDVAGGRGLQIKREGRGPAFSLAAVIRWLRMRGGGGRGGHS